MKLARWPVVAVVAALLMGSPCAAFAQQRVPLVGFIGITSPEALTRPMTAFREGLRSAGFVDGSNVAIEYRWARNRLDRIPEFATELVGRNVAAIVACCGNEVVSRVKAATATIPIIFEDGTNPVEIGLVASLNRPGGNLTGVNSLIVEVWSKSFDLMTKLLPASRVLATLDAAGITAQQIAEAQAAAAIAGRNLLQFSAGSPQQVDEAFASIKQQGAEGLIIRVSPFFYDRRDQIVALAARYGIPTIHPFRESVEAGGLMSYNIDLDNSFRIMGGYTGRVLKGEKPADMPVQQATKFELMINLRTAKSLGLEMPPRLLAIADQVIE
jgi:putative tryptophan/tyrosine transport system substrate-binding protein